MEVTPIRTAAVLGAGVMGAQIAAHLANAGVPTLLLDLSEELARTGFHRARTLQPDPFFVPENAALIATGSFDRDLVRAAESDWVIEAAIEQADAKRALLERVDAARRDHTIVSSNTSGIPIARLGEGRSDGFRRHWLGTHFFNPPRYLRLLEVIPTADTDPAVVERIIRFADYRLGKGVVIAKDTPTFIANRIGLYGAVRVLHVLQRGDFTIEEIDAMTGRAIGRPKSATFRTLDFAGIDVLGLVAGNLIAALPDAAAQREFSLPPIVGALIERGWTGEKAGQGFYKKQRSADGRSEILALEPAAMTYRPRLPVRLGALDAVRSIENAGERVKTLMLETDRVGAFLRETLGATLLYAARMAPIIARSIDEIDRAMQWGFNWELGPFETWDAIGVRELLDLLDSRHDPPALAADVLAAGRNRFRDDGIPVSDKGLLILKSAKAQERTLRRNAGASLVDLGDGVLGVEFHSKMNALGPDALEMLRAGLKEASTNFCALVVGGEAANFSAGANLVLLLFEAQEGNWDEIDAWARAFQDTTTALRYADVPVVIAPAGLTLGGACEIVLHGDRVRAAAESYIGLVETGVGLIPSGGGTKEMVARAVDDLPDPSADLLPFVRGAFETMAFAKVSTSAVHARRLGFLRDVDGVTMNRDRLLADAANIALERVREGYRPPPRRTAIPVGGDGVAAALKLAVHLAWRAGRITDHDALVGRALANVVAGGSLPHRTTVTEQYLLDLEREAFLKLCGERKTLERIQHTLKTGKPLRN